MKIPVRALIGFVGLALSTAVPAGTGERSAAQDPVVDAPAGSVRGVIEDNARKFRAIPYAKPPLGALRWRAPQPLPRWAGIRAAQSRGAACIQPPMAQGPYDRGAIDMSEDCLTLDVTAPENARNAPVMIWIHGGTLIWGSAQSAMYDGREFAKRGIILVSINYRLGVLGYLAHPELGRETAEGVSGNYGLQDQIAALQWVRRNIRAFGGDPHNVTIFGESAGALSVEYLMASPHARGLFGKAVAQSGYMFTMPELRNARYGEQSAEAIGVALAGKLGAKSIADLRAMDARKLSVASAMAGFLPYGTIDGHILKRQLVDTFDRGEQAPVPLIAGLNSGETRSLRQLLPPLPASADAYTADIRARYGDASDAYLRLYPATDPEQARLDASRDGIYSWAMERLARAQARLGQPSYLYLFSHSYPSADEAGLTGFHASEVPFIFGNFQATPPNWPRIPDDAGQRRIADAMLDYWTSFARTGRPIAQGASEWLPFGTDNAFMRFEGGPRMAQKFMPGVFDLHERIMCRRRASGAQSWDWRVGAYAPVLPVAGKGCA
ncbi:carboxylesterase/lipase family protein [Sphingomonas colocasiae]|uniref:Carboxylic ester hydrolase n=1 Tax=Sphingomonas colocasiae TaxID=1848973 RepID=A0ABS7PWR2_9SPHN|nr:carboxylesterase family protein [Sphingomonas colocasiae]MBY8825648.1 carboxylesterase family protein [Sphingomonas colocasiae]